MIFFKNKKKNKKKRKNNKLNFSGGLFSVLTFSSLVVIIFVFHLFLYKQIESLIIEKEIIKEKVTELIDEKNYYSDQYSLIFDENQEKIANNFYGHGSWKRQVVIKNHIVIDR